MKKFDVLIIGGGSVSASFLYQLDELLAKKHHKILKIALIESSPQCGVGYAYHTGNNDDLLLNTASELMGVSISDRQDFLSWLKAGHYRDKAVTRFPSRALFAEYLKSRLKHVLEKSKHICLSIMQQDVRDVLVGHDEVTVFTDQEMLIGHTVVFSHGGSFGAFAQGFSQNPAFIKNPYNVADIESIPAGSRILVVGTSLTMFDAFLLLRSTAKTYDITIASRSGYFPAVKDGQIDHLSGKKILDRLQAFRKKNQKVDKTNFIHFVDSALSEYFGKPYSIELSTAQYADFLKNPSKNMMQYCDRNNFSPLSIYLAQTINELWRLLPEKDKDALEELIKYSFRFIGAIPVETHSKVAGHFDAKHFNICLLDSLQAEHGKFLAQFKNSSQAKLFDYVINCTGISGYYHPSNLSELSQNIRRRRQLKINQSHGLSTTQNGQILLQDGSLAQNLYAIGVSGDGTHFNRSSFIFYAEQAHKVADLITRYGHSAPIE